MTVITSHGSDPNNHLRAVFLADQTPDDEPDTLDLRAAPVSPTTSEPDDEDEDDEGLSPDASGGGISYGWPLDGPNGGFLA